MERPVIIPGSMDHTDGFTLLGFESWEDVQDQKLVQAATEIANFSLTKDSVGFNS